MKAKFSLLAYVNGKRVTVNVTVKNPEPPTGASKYYLRYTDAIGKRHDEALGDSFQHALAELRTREARQDYERKTGEKFPEKKN